jgi:hypothetical protein
MIKKSKVYASLIYLCSYVFQFSTHTGRYWVDFFLLDCKAAAQMAGWAPIHHASA